MTRLDRYILGHLLAASGFFLLVFTGVVWLTQAVRLIDLVLASGQGARIFLSFSVLVLPQVMVIVLPLCGIGAALYALNKLYSDSELTVMMSAGMGPLTLLRSAWLFGALIAAAMATTLIVLVPISGRILAERTLDIRSDLAGALIVERQFIHPLAGLTLFIEDTNSAGEMAGIFLNDQRDIARAVTYSAESALLVRDDMEVRLVMRDGVALSSGDTGERLNSVTFDQFVFDLSDLIDNETTRIPRPSERSVMELLNPTDEMLADGRYDRGDFVAEGHYKISLPLLAMTYPMIALVTLLAGGYRRSGFGRRVIVAIGVAVVIQLSMFALKARVEDAAAFWPLMYVPHLLAALYIAALLIYLERGGRRLGTAAT